MAAQVNSKHNSLAAQEIAFAKILAGNDAKQRHRAVRKLNIWLRTRCNGNNEFTEDEFIRIWTGLFYCMWMSDKFLVQEELAESLSQLIHCFEKKKNAAILFIQVFNKILTSEWSGLDQHRIDKFAMLVRRFLRQSLEYCRRKNWDCELLQRLMNVFKSIVLVPNKSAGYTLHFIEIYLEELAKVSKGELNNNTVITAVEPFVKLLSRSKDVRICKSLNAFFMHLMKQTDVGIESEEKFQAWKAQGFPGKSPDSLQPVDGESEDEDDDHVNKASMEDSDENGEDIPLDPRAGQVDVELPQIPIKPDSLITLFNKYLDLRSTGVRGKKSLRRLIHQFESLKRGKFPLAIKKDPILDEIPKKQKRKNMVLQKAKELLEFEEKLDKILESKGKDIKFLSTDNFDGEETSEDEAETRESEEREVETEIEEKKMKDQENRPQVAKKKKKEKRESIKVRVSPKRKQGENSVTLLMKKNGIIAKEDSYKVKKNKLTQSPSDNQRSPDTGKIKSSPKKLKIENEAKDSPSLKLNGSLSGSGKKRKILGDWQVHEIDSNSPEYTTLKLPKIIKLEKKANAFECEEKIEAIEPTGLFDYEAENEKTKENQNGDLHVFWEKAKNKLNKKNVTPRKSLPSDLILEKDKNDKPQGSRRISFALHRNMAQENEEYLEEVKNSPKIPFDGSKKPIQSALKPGLSSSPINPFYRLKKK